MKTISQIITGLSLLVLTATTFINRNMNERIHEVNHIDKDVITKETFISEGVSVDVLSSQDRSWEVSFSEHEDALYFDYLFGDVRLVLDLDDAIDDGKEIGFSVSVNGNPYSGINQQLISPLLTKDSALKLNVQINGEELMIQSWSGTLGDLVNIDYDKAIKMYASIQVLDQNLNIDLGGLYRISSFNSSAEFICNQLGHVSTYQVDQNEILSDVSFIKVLSGNGMPIFIDSQVRTLEYIGNEFGELSFNFGAAYSHGGQSNVASTLIISEHISTGTTHL